MSLCGSGTIDIRTKNRFEAKFVKGDPDECWTWMASRNQDGYGMFRLKYGTRSAHRIMWELTYGEIPKGLEICHTCDNPPCVNPEHLFLGTHQDNVQDMFLKGRSAIPMQYLGYRWDKGNRHWQAYVSVRGKTYNLGGYPKREHAAYARKLGERILKEGGQIDARAIRERVRQSFA